jgi:uncharacterized membrane protein YhaH (DUF805 family)
MTFFQAIRMVFRKYADFTGTASRSEFWWWALFGALVSAGLNASSAAVADGATTLNALWSLGVLLPSLAVSVRRMRDAEYSWHHVLWILLPIVGILIIAVLCAQPSKRRLQPPAVVAQARSESGS